MKKKEEAASMTRRQFAKGLAKASVGAIGGALLGPVDAFAEQEGKVQEARRKYVNTLNNSPHIIDEKRYKRFSVKNMTFNVLSRELGESWVNIQMRNMMNNVMQGKSSSVVDAGSKENARAELAMYFATAQSNLYLGR